MFVSGYEAVLNRKSRNSTEIVNSIKRRLSKTLDIPGTDSEIAFAQWLSRLPCQSLIPILCSKSAENRFDLQRLSRSARDSGAPSSYCNSVIADDMSEAEHLQEHRLDEPKDESVSSPCNTDDSITPEPRQRAFALDRSRTPVAGALDTAL